VVATNKASFGDTPVSDQFIAMTSMRAAELGTPLVHAAITGRSAFIGADGEVQSRTDAFETDILLGTVNYRTAGLTLYARFGDWLQYLAVAVGGAVLSAGWINRRRERAAAGAETEIDA
jgi:apolipoprotein N-acyltransferase